MVTIKTPTTFGIPKANPPPPPRFAQAPANGILLIISSIQVFQ